MTHAAPVLRGFPRWLDACAALAGLLLLSPLFVLLALWVRTGSPGPVLHRARRMGRGGIIFPLLKFRSMYVDAEQNGPGITHAADARITRAGAVLRRWKLDELPQLVNVLRGEMSLVGPRPEDPRYLAHYPDELRGVLSLRPGITSAASLTYRNESALLTAEDPERQYIEQVLPAKLRIDMEYFTRATLRSHLRLIVRTVTGAGSA